MKKHIIGKHFVNKEGENRSRLMDDDFMMLINRIPPEKRTWDNPLYFESMICLLLFNLKKRVDELEGKTPKPKKKKKSLPAEVEKHSEWLLERAREARENIWKEHPIC